MTKEDKQIIDRGIKENWRIGDRTRLKRLLEKNLKLYRENVELENKIADIKANCDLAIEGRDIKIMELKKENAELKGIKDVATLIRANNDTVVTLMQLNNKLVSKNQQLTRAKEIIRALLFHLTNDTFYVIYKTQEQSVEQARQFLKEIEK